MGTSSRNSRRACAQTGGLLVALGAWAAVLPVALGLLEGPDAQAVLPGAVVALSGALIVHGRPRSIRAGGLLAVGAALWFVVSPLDRLFDPGASVGALEWCAFFFAPGMLIMLVGVHALGFLEAPDAIEERATHPRHSLRARDPHRRLGHRGAHGDRREVHARGGRRVRRDA